MREAAARLLSNAPESVLQYAPTEGSHLLREWIGRRHGVSADRVLITTGSQQALDLVAKVLIDPGRRVLLEDPSYLGALQAFFAVRSGYGASCVRRGWLSSRSAGG